MDERMNIYMNDEDKANVNRLLNAMAEEGDTRLISNRGTPSYSALFRVLVSNELERRGLPIDKRKEVVTAQ